MHRKLIIFTIFSALGLLLSLNVSRAEKDGIFPAPLTNSLPIEVTARMETVADLNPIARYIVESSAGKFTFLVDSAYRVDTSNPERVTLSGKRYDRFITFRLLNGESSLTDPLHHGPFRALVALRYPNASVTAESTGHADSKTGPVFQLELVPVQGVRQLARIFYMPCGTGILEISHIGNANEFEQKLSEFDRLLLTVRTAGPASPLEINQISSRL